MNEKPIKRSGTSYALFGILIFAALVAVGGASLYLYQVEQAKQTRAQQEEKQRAEQEKLERVALQKAELQKLFDDYLNDFITDLRAAMQEYKESRRVLKEMVEPYNYESLEYAKENYTLFNESVAPMMREKADQIINIFAAYNQKVEQNLSGKENELQAHFRGEWKKMSEEQAGEYVDFFSKEETRLQAYGELIKFYYTHYNLYDVDAQANVFLFKRDEEAEMHELLTDQINDIQ